MRRAGIAGKLGFDGAVEFLRMGRGGERTHSIHQLHHFVPPQRAAAQQDFQKRHEVHGAEPVQSGAGEIESLVLGVEQKLHVFMQLRENQPDKPQVALNRPQRGMVFLGEIRFAKPLPLKQSAEYGKNPAGLIHSTFTPFPLLAFRVL